jgi:hypothetical protein
MYFNENCPHNKNLIFKKKAPEINKTSYYPPGIKHLERPCGSSSGMDGRMPSNSPGTFLPGFAIRAATYGSISRTASFPSLPLQCPVGRVPSERVASPPS